MIAAAEMSFREFAMQSIADLSGIARHVSNRYLAASAGQLVASKQACLLGDRSLMERHLARAKQYWTHSQETQADQEKRAIAKVAQLKASGVGRELDDGTVTRGNPHMSMGDMFQRVGQARGERSFR